MRRITEGVSRRQLQLIVGLSAVLAGVSVPLLAGATDYNPTSDITNLTSSAGTTLGPLVVIVITGLIGLFALFWAVNFVVGIMRGRRARA